jgi:hypothetical protein
MKPIYSLLLALFCCFFYAGCSQEPLFWDIAHAYPPIEPLIGGAPSQIVATSSAVYVSNGTIWEYSGASWHTMANQPPGGKVKTLAASGTVLFALGWNGSLNKWDGSNWTPITYSGKVEQIYSAGGYLFAAESTGSDTYQILSMSVSATTLSTVIGADTGFLTGAADNGGSTTFLGTSKGLYRGSGGALGTLEPNVESVVGIIRDSSDIVAVTAERNVYRSSGGGSFTRIYLSNYPLSGALAIWDKGAEKILLMGVQTGGGSYSYGYRELNLAAPYIFKEPGAVDLTAVDSAYATSVELGSQYVSAIGKRAVTVLYVIPGSYSGDDIQRPIVLASTVKDGLWSYRVRGGMAQWNGEDNSN